MGILVAPPPVSPRLFGLFSVVGAFREGERFQQGVEWEQRPLDTPGIVAFDDLCKQVSNEPGVGRLFEDAVTFRVTHGVECTPVGETAAEMEARTVSRLVSWEEKDVEHTVWSSATPKLVDGAAPGVVDDAVAIAQAEAFAASWNMQGVIHMPVGVAARMADKGLVKVNGRQLTTKMLTPVVAGAGYDTPHLVVTGAVFIYRSEAYTDAAFDMGMNNREVFASRDYLVGFDTVSRLVIGVAPVA